MVDRAFEHTLWNLGVEFVAGVDEAGRGPLAGPVVAAAVILGRACSIEGIDDSKKLAASRREALFPLIQESALGIGIGILSPGEIDKINIYQASMRAMEYAVRTLTPRPHHILVDGPRYHERTIPFTAIVDGDARCYSIAAASIVAKVTRDRIMKELHECYPEYGFARHKGYGTAEHFAALRKYGPCPAHRKSFRMPSRDGATDGG